MKILSGLLAVIALLMMGIFVAGSMLPTEIKISRTIEIQAPVKRVFNIVNSFDEYNEWSPWYELDPNALYKTLGRSTGIGARFEWESNTPELGRGSQQIVDSAPYHFVKVELQYGLQGNGYSTYDLEATDATTTQFSWAYESDLGDGLLARYFGLALKKRLAQDCERGLKNLKRLAEASVEDSGGRSLEASLKTGINWL
ncbi:MAG: SRPBCC family protein [Pseudomonadota bacterium]